MSTEVMSTTIKSKIHIIRGVRVMLDKDLSELYQVTARALRQQMKRNKERFPNDFSFQLTEDEASTLVSQNVTPSMKHYGGSLPYAFTEQGVAMLSSVLKSKIAVQINIKIIRAFIELRQQISSHPEYELLREKIRRIESEQDSLKAIYNLDSKIVENKVIKLSSEVYRMSQILDEFQDSHLIIKRPTEYKE